MAIISANLQFNRGGHGLLDYSSLQKNYSDALLWAQDVNSNAAVGQFIYLEETETIGEVTYAKGPYVVDAIGEGAVLTPLSKSVAGKPDLASIVSNLQGEVGTLKSGLATTDSSVNTLESKVAALPATIVSDVKDASGNSLVVDGVATLGDYATKTEVGEGLAKKVDVSVYDSKMAQVDASIAEKADASTVYTKSEVDNSLNLKANIADVYSKTVADTTFVKSDGYVAFSQDEKDKLAGIATGAEVNYIKSVGDNLSVTNGKLEVSIPSVPEYNVVKLGTAEDGYAASYQLQKDGSAIGATINIPKDMVVSKGEVVENPEGHDEGLYIVLTLANATNDKLYIPANKLVDDYTGSTYIEVASNGEISIKYNDLKVALKADFDSVYDASGLAAAVDNKLEAYKTSNDASVASKVDSSVYTAKVAEIDGSLSSINTSLETKAVKADVSAALELKANAADVYDSSTVDNLLSAKVDNSTYTSKVNAIDGSISAINTNLDGKVDKVEGSSLVSDELITKLGNMVEIKSVSGDLTFTDGALSLDLSAYAKSADIANTYVAKEDGKGLSTNDFTNDLKSKLDGIAAGAEVNIVKSVDTTGVLGLNTEGKLTADLSAYATSDALTDGLATKLDASAKVNGVSFTNGEATLDAGDIALEAAITRTREGGVVENVYAVETSIQSVLANLSHRIDVLDPSVLGELGITSIVEGNGVKVETADGQATISVKASEVEGNMAEIKTDGIYVQDMRSYWEEI